MNASETEGAVQYLIRIGEYVGDRAWDDTVAELESRLPRLAGFISQHYSLGEPFELPRVFAQEQALRLRSVLNRLGLQTTIVPTGGCGDAAIDSLPQTPADATATLPEALSRFLAFAGLPPEFGGLLATSEFGLLCRLIGGLLSVPAWRWLLGDWFDWQWSTLIVATVIGWYLDIFLLWIGSRLLLPRTTVPCTRIEAAISPLAFLEALPIVGVVMAPFWRVALRIQGVADLADVGAGRAAMVILVPWMGVAIFVSTVVLALMLIL